MNFKTNYLNQDSIGHGNFNVVKQAKGISNPDSKGYLVMIISKVICLGSLKVTLANKTCKAEVSKEFSKLPSHHQGHLQLPSKFAKIMF